MKALADNKINVTEKLKGVLERVENIEGKEENAGYQHFLRFPQFFQNASLSRMLEVEENAGYQLFPQCFQMHPFQGRYKSGLLGQELKQLKKVDSCQPVQSHNKQSLIFTKFKIVLCKHSKLFHLGKG